MKIILISNLPTNYFNINSINSKSDLKNLKHFIYFLCLYNLIFKKSEEINVEKTKIIALPKERKSFTLLRAPFRHKLTKKNYSLIRYKTIVLFNITTAETLKINNLKNLILYIKFLLGNVYWFESNVQYIYKISLSLNIIIKKYKL